MDKTNVMRFLDAKGIAHVERDYDPEITTGTLVAQALGEDVDCVFKTLVTEDPKHQHYVFCIPVASELDLKKAAKAIGAKSIAMIHQKELLPLTGYVHGGCSPMGLKKPFPVCIDETAMLFDVIFVSAGRRGFQVGLNPMELLDAVQGKFVDLVAN